MLPHPNKPQRLILSSGLGPYLQAREDLKEAMTPRVIPPEERRVWIDAASQHPTFPMLYPRNYAAPGGWYTPKDAATDHIANLLALQRFPNDTIIRQAMICAIRMIDERMPTYWIPKTLLDDLLMTKPPLDITPEDINWVMPSMQIMLPHGALIDSEGHDIKWIAMADIDLDWAKTLPGVGGREDSVSKRALVLSSVSAAGVTWSTWIPGQDKVFSIADEEFEAVAFYETEECRLQDAEKSRVFSVRLASLCVNILLYLAAKRDAGELDEAVETGQIARMAKPAKHLKELWNASWIGRRYDKARKAYAGGSHASPRVHWRMGHFNYYRTGVGRLGPIVTRYIPRQLINT